MRGILLVVALVVPTGQGLASEIGGGSLFLTGDGLTIEQILSATPRADWEGLNQGPLSLDDMDGVLLGSQVALENDLTDNVPPLLVRAGTKDRQMHETNSDLAQNRHADSRNTTVIHPMAGKIAIDDPAPVVASKGDLVLTPGMKSNLSFSFHDANLRGSDPVGKPTFITTRLDGPGVAAAILFALWSLMTVVTILVHFKQEAEQRRDFAMLQSFRWKRVQSRPKSVYPEEEMPQVHHDTHLAHDWRVMNQTANSNTDHGAAHAA